MKLFDVLNTLESRERTRFHHYLSTPFFNKRRDVQLLFSIWLEMRGKPFSIREYWQRIYPEQEYSVKTWNLLTSRLFKLLVDFIALVEMRKNKTHKKFFLAKAYRKRKKEKLFKAAIKSAGVELEKQNFRDTDYLQGQHDLSFEKYDYVSSSNRKEKTNLQEVSDHLDAYILAAKLRQACYALSREIVNQEKCEVGLLTEVLAYVAQHPKSQKIPAIAIYYYCYLAISSVDSEQNFLRLREAISAYQHYFPPSEMRDIYTLAINYTIRRLNTGSPLFGREAFELYLLILEEGYLLEDGIMLESAFSNIVFLAAKLEKYDWARKFIYDYQKHLKPVFQEPLFHFSLGKLYYEQGHLEESLQQLIQVETKASFLLLGARILQLKIYYKLEEFTPLESLLDSLRVYLQRSKDLGYRKQHYNNILIFTRQLLQLPVMTKSERAQLRQRIESAEIFAEKDWFLEQIS